MNALLAAVCCCQGGPEFGEYYVFTSCSNNPCCPNECASGLNIYWCPAYAIQQGLQPPLTIDAGSCLMIKYECCLYRLTSVVSITGACPPSGATGLWNVGSVVGFKSISGAETCCTYQNIPLPSTCLTSIAFGTGHTLTASQCAAYVVQPYTLTDQWGTVPSKPVTIQSTLTYCYETFGAAPSARCEGCPPITHYQKSVTHAQQIGYCIPLDAGPTVCEGQRTFTSLEYLTCSECNPCGDCCGAGDPCDGVDPLIDFCEDPQNTWAVRTCYSVNNCLDASNEQLYFEQDVLTITYDACATDLDITDPEDQAVLEALFSGGNTVASWSSNSSFGSDDTGIVLKLCIGSPFGCPCVYVFSGNAANIADAVNSMFMNFPFVSATHDPVWGEHFWFGVRQTCDVCDGDPAGTRPAYQPPSESDELVFDRLEFNGSTSFSAIFKGRSKKKFVCAAQTLISDYSISANCAGSNTDVVNCCISATGDIDNGYDLDCISPAEYDNGSRYSMRQIEQDYCEKYICTSSNPSAAVTGCDASVGYPLYDVVVMGLVVQKGWQSLCGGGLGLMPAGMQFKCRTYPYQYEVAPCCPYDDPASCAIWEAANPTPEPCVDRCFQDAGYYCESDATIIQVIT